MLLFEYCKHIQGQLHSQTQIFYSKLLKKIGDADVCFLYICVVAYNTPKSHIFSFLDRARQPQISSSAPQSS